MVEQDRVDGERGSIVTLASIEGLEGTAGGSAYNASKGGVVLLTKNIAIDYGPIGIRANAICPGFIDTPLAQGVFDMPGMEGVTAELTREHALRRRGRPGRDRRRRPRSCSRPTRRSSPDRRSPSTAATPPDATTASPS